MTASTVFSRLRIPPSVLWVGGLMTGCLIFVGLLFPRAAGGAIRVWIGSPTYNHCFLVLPLSLFLIWQRRDRTGLLEISPNPWWILLISGLSILWLLTAAVGVLEAQQFVVLTITEAMLLTVLGLQTYRKFLAPFLYLYFLIPTGAFLVPWLQDFTARFSVAGLHLLGIPVFSTGAVIEIPAGTFAVAEACAGLRFLVAAVAFGTFFAILNFESWWRRGLFVALSIVVPIVANGLRALGLIAAAEWLGSPSAALADHILYGWLFFSFVLIALILIGYSFSDRRSAEGESLKICEGRFQRISRRRKLITVAGISLIAAASGPIIFIFSSRVGAVPLPVRAPALHAPWIQTSASTDWHPIVSSPDRVFADTFADGHFRVDRFVALYSSAISRNLIRSENRDADERVWTFNSASRGNLRFDDQKVLVTVSKWFRGRHSRIVWSFFIVNGIATGSSFGAKWAQVRNLFHGNRCASAYVALSLKDINEEVGSRVIEDYIRSGEPVASFFCP